MKKFIKSFIYALVVLTMVTGFVGVFSANNAEELKTYQSKTTCFSKITFEEIELVF